MKLSRPLAVSVLIVSLPLAGLAVAGQDQITSKDLPDQTSQTRIESSGTTSPSDTLPPSHAGGIWA